MSIQSKSFGTVSSGAQTHLYSIRASGGGKTITAAFTDFGASLVSLIVPDQNGDPVDVVLGYDSAQEYEAGSCFFGAAIGRVGNRIANGRFTLNGAAYQMDLNENGNCLHGGFRGYDKRIWETAEVKEDSVSFRLTSPDGDQGMPGTLTLIVTYTVSAAADGCALTLHYNGVCDQDTLLNPTNHSYFNLNGQGSGSILGHLLKIYAQQFTAVQDAACIPREDKDVEGTPFDFREWKVIGQEIDDPNCLQLTYGQGYDHNFSLCAQKGAKKIAAEVKGELSGITMQVRTDLPCIQFYAGNQISPQHGKGGARYEKRSGLCLETQYRPDSIHAPEFAQCILKADDTFDSATEYLFRS